MPASYTISLEDTVLRIAFGSPADNSQIVRDAEKRLEELRSAGELKGGPLLKINGPASLPVMTVITHKVAHLYGAVAIFDPKLAKYVVSITHDPQYRLGDLLD